MPRLLPEGECGPAREWLRYKTGSRATDSTYRYEIRPDKHDPTDAFSREVRRAEDPAVIVRAASRECQTPPSDTTGRREHTIYYSIDSGQQAPGNSPILDCYRAPIW